MTSTCKKLQIKRRNDKMSARQVLAESVSFMVNGGEIERVKEFKYLGRIFSENEDDTKCIEGNLKKARSRWWRISKVLKREGADAR